MKSFGPTEAAYRAAMNAPIWYIALVVFLFAACLLFSAVAWEQNAYDYEAVQPIETEAETLQMAA